MPSFPRHDFRSTARQNSSPVPDNRNRFLHGYIATPALPQGAIEEAVYTNFETVTPQPLIKTAPRHTFFRWQTYEFSYKKPGRAFLFWSGLFLIALVGYALYSNSPIMAITFVLIGLTGYTLLHKDPRFLDCHIIQDGIIVNRELYTFDSIVSFWIFALPDRSFLSLKTRTLIAPCIHVPIEPTDADMLRDVLSQFIPEKKQEPLLIDIFEKMLHS